MREKIIIIDNSFDKLLTTFGGRETEKTADHTSWSSEFKLCDQSGKLIERRKEADKYSIMFQFSFETKTDLMAFRFKNQQLLNMLKEIYSQWKYDEDSEENRSLVYYSFADGVKSSSGFKRSVILSVTNFS